MKTTVRRGNKKRLKSPKEAKRDVNNRSKALTTQRDYPIAETLRWMTDGEKLLRKWGAIKSPTAKRIASVVATVLTLLETINEVRKM